MPPKEAPKKPVAQIARPPLADSSLLYIPEEAIEGYQERIETGIEWTLIEKAARHHRNNCLKDNIPTKLFIEALNDKINNSIFGSVLEEESGLTLEQIWDFLLPATLWDNQVIGSEETKMCFNNANVLVDDMVGIIKQAVRENDRKVVGRELVLTKVLRVPDAQMTDLDEHLLNFKQLVNLNLCGNFIEEPDPNLIPPTVKTLEFQANRIRNLDFCGFLPPDLLYLGLAKNFLSEVNQHSFSNLPRHIKVLDISDNDLCDIEDVIEALALLPFLTSLYLDGNPCAYCAAYCRVTVGRLPRLQWLDGRQILPTDRPESMEPPHADDMLSNYFSFAVFRVMSAPTPPKIEKGSIATFHVEIEVPLLDSKRRNFLMFRSYESLYEKLPLPEDYPDWNLKSTATVPTMTESKSVMGEISAHESDIYKQLTTKDSRIIENFTTFESNRVPWNKIMNFQEPALRIFCPDLKMLRDTFRSVITLRLIYTLTVTTKPAKSDKKSVQNFRPPGEQRLVLATMKCPLRKTDWSQPMQHFHWDDSLSSVEAIHWGDGDLSILQYNQLQPKAGKPGGKPEEGKSEKPDLPDNLTCHFGFGIDSIRY